MSPNHVINLSSAWDPPDPDAGSSTWVRRFGMPAGLTPLDRVWLVVESPRGCGPVLAGARLASVPAGELRRYEVTGSLRPRNELSLTAEGGAVPLGAASPGRRDLPATIGRVWLEIAPADGAPAAPQPPA